MIDHAKLTARVNDEAIHLSLELSVLRSRQGEQSDDYRRVLGALDKLHRLVRSCGISPDRVFDALTVADPSYPIGTPDNGQTRRRRPKLNRSGSDGPLSRRFKQDDQLDYVQRVGAGLMVGPARRQPWIKVSSRRQDGHSR